MPCTFGSVSIHPPSRRTQATLTARTFRSWHTSHTRPQEEGTCHNWRICHSHQGWPLALPQAPPRASPWHRTCRSLRTCRSRRQEEGTCRSRRTCRSHRGWLRALLRGRLRACMCHSFRSHPWEEGTCRSRRICRSRQGWPRARPQVRPHACPWLRICHSWRTFHSHPWEEGNRLCGMSMRECQIHISRLTVIGVLSVAVRAGLGPLRLQGSLHHTFP